MRRLQLFEWEDQPWLPRVLRDFITDQLRYTHTEAMRRPVNEAVADLVVDVIKESGHTRIIDLCSGGGGPVTEIAKVLAEKGHESVEIVVTDLFPNVGAFRELQAGSGGRIRARFEPTDAADVPEDLRGVRTLFTAVHHFPPPLVARVLTDAVRKRAPIALFEPLERTARMALLVGFMSFIRGFTHAGIAGRLTLKRFLLTYVLPVAPFVFAWDGAVSTARSYTAAELMAIAQEVSTEGYVWRSGRFEVPGPYGPMPTTYLIGIPV